MAGAYGIVEDTDDFGFALELGHTGEGVLAPIAAGVLTPLRVSNAQRIELGEEYGFTAVSRCMIALDGEREVRVQPGDYVGLTIDRDGPWRGAAADHTRPARSSACTNWIRRSDNG